MRTQCNSKPLEFEGQGRRRLVAKKLIFLWGIMYDFNHRKAG